jgi:methylated-DNA-protein-cysteine methyltransferase-like protein
VAAKSAGRQPNREDGARIGRAAVESGERQSNRASGQRIGQLASESGGRQANRETGGRIGELAVESGDGADTSRVRSRHRAEPMKKPADSAPGRYRKIYAVIARIPRGRVATYGQVAVHAGLPGHAREVGTALARLPDGSTIPWHRVINARGAVSDRGDLGVREGYQRHLLEEEGVRFDARGRVDLERIRWDPASRPPRRR